MTGALAHLVFSKTKFSFHIFETRKVPNWSCISSGLYIKISCNLSSKTDKIWNAKHRPYFCGFRVGLFFWIASREKPWETARVWCVIYCPWPEIIRYDWLGRFFRNKYFSLSYVSICLIKSITISRIQNSRNFKMHNNWIHNSE